MNFSWHPRTKVIPPRLRPDLVLRGRLLDRLQRDLKTHSLILLSAPAGYGKTTLLASLPASFPEQPVAWVSLSPDDNDLARFATGLLMSIQQTTPQFGSDTRALLSTLSDPAADVKRVMRVLINEGFDELPNTWIILDDLHYVTDPTIHAGLDYFLECIPSHLRLLISTRHDPPLSLARLRARGQLAELRAPDLRFTEEEAEIFLNDNLQLSLSSDNLIKAEGYTEGWPAGLRLLAGTLDPLHSGEDRARFIMGLEQTDRFVFEYLAEEVLSRLEPDQYRFVLETSILTELTHDLCNSITDRRDSHEILEELYRRNLFLTKIGEKGSAFRYHALFSEFLRDQFQRDDPEGFTALHRRAGLEYETHDRAQAVYHYLSAEAWEDAAEVIEDFWDLFLRQGYLRTLGGWIESLPVSVRNTHPRLPYLMGWCAIQSGQWDQATRHLESALTGFRSVADAAGQAETLLQMIDVASRQHHFARQDELVKQAVASPLSVQGQVQVLIAQVWQSLFQANMKQADESLERALDLTLTADDQQAFHIMAPLLNMHLAHLPGGTERLERYSREVLARFGGDVGLIPACAHSLLGYILLLKGSLEASKAEISQSLAIFNQIGEPAYTEAQNMYTQTTIAAIQGDPSRAESSWVRFLPRVEETPMLRPYAPAVLYFICRMQWMQGKFDEARQHSDTVAPRGDVEEHPEIAMARKLMHALAQIIDRGFIEAERTLEEALAIEARWPYSAMFGSSRALLAFLHLNDGREDEAWSLFLPFLEDCERRKLPGLILQEMQIGMPLLQMALHRKNQAGFAERVLAQLTSLDSSLPVPIPGTGQRLTPREVEVLKLIVEGASNRGIAQRLVISEHTVKVHNTSIFAKLEVTSRMEAAARARELRLV